jgi:RNA polymerase sigma-70 factor (ECF subfamily)
LPDEGAGPERTLSAQADLAHIVAILNRIEPGLREAIVLTAFVGMSQAEAAATLGVSLKTVEGRVFRARSRLALYLSR